MYELGYVYRRQIIWHYENGFAGYGKRSLNACYEPLLFEIARMRLADAQAQLAQTLI